jgi:hypothetical protein
MNKKAVLVISAFLMFLEPVQGEGVTEGKGVSEDVYRYAITLTSETIEIDGVLSEGIWDRLPVADGFWMSFPVDDRKVEERLQTEVRMCSDGEYLYIGAVCYGPEDYVIKTLKRDAEFWDSDAFGVVIDPVNEKTNGFTFGVSPAGVQTEYLVTGQTGRREDLEPGRLRKGVNLAWDNKWFAEVSNYPDHWVVEIAIPFKSLRFKENQSNWGINFFRRDASTNTIHTWAPVPIEFNETDLGYTGVLSWESAPEKTPRNFSIIPYVRAGVSKDYQADTPADPIFQAGLDAKVPVTSSMNLDLALNPDFSQVEVDEQVVNLTLFDIRLPEKRLFFLENDDVFGDFGINPMRPFFSRKIGLDENGAPIPILYGARLSGNVNENLRMGVMNLQTRQQENFLAQNYTVAAFHQRVLARSVVKGYLQNRDALKAEGPDYNRLGGLEFLYQSQDGRFQTFGGYSKSLSPGMTRKSSAFHTGISYDNRNISAYSNLSGMGENYRADMGYLLGQRYYDAERDTSIYVGFYHLFTRLTYTFYPENSRRILSHEFHAQHIYDGDTVLSMLQNEVKARYTLKFKSTAQARIAYTNGQVNLLYPFRFISGDPLPVGIYHNNETELSFQTDQRSLFSVKGLASYGSFYGGTRTRLQLQLKYRAQPWGNFSVNFEQNDLKFPAPYGEDNLFLISPRIEINFSRSLFWTTFLQYNTQFDNFNINSRFQWRFAPMSDFYVVYTDNYAVEFWGPKNRAVVIKLNYWFSL